MAKKVAVLVVNPVNGAGLFQYLEAFYENGIPYKTFAVAETSQVKTNSGIDMKTDDVIANLKGNESEYDALVFACGDAVPKFTENVQKPYNQDMLAVMKNFDANGKILAGHCGAALLFDNLGIGKGNKVALHPYIKNLVKGCVATDEQAIVDGKLYTAQTENAIPSLIPDLLNTLK